MTSEEDHSGSSRAPSQSPVAPTHDVGLSDPESVPTAQPAESRKRRAAQPSRKRNAVKRRLPSNLLKPPPPDAPTPKPEGALRLMTLNLAHGRKKGPHQLLQRRASLEQNLDLVGQLLGEASPDIVALQEADGPSWWSGNFCHVSRLSDNSGLDHHYRGPHTEVGRGRLQLKCGTALLSRLPIDDRQSVSFGQNWRDNKGFVAGSVRVPEWNDMKVLIASVHLDFLIPSVRRRQVHRIIETLSQREHPLILMGDLNCSPLEDPKTLQMLLHDLDLESCDLHLHRPTYPSYRPMRRLDWILASPELRFVDKARPLDRQVSDHLAVMADFVPA